MIRKRLLIIVGVVIVAITLQINGQSTQGAFDVASIKPVPPPFPTTGGPWTVSRGRFKAELGQVRAVIAWAYDLLPGQVKAGPDWIDREPYFIDARSERGPMYTLAVGKDGPKLQDAITGRRNLVTWTGRGKVTFTEITTMLALRGILSGMLNAPVVDRTGLGGTYNYSLEYRDPRDPRPIDANSPPDVFTAIQDQLGLRLQATDGPVEVVVIDHIERPTPN
jgi:hypothetical protein